MMVERVAIGEEVHVHGDLLGADLIRPARPDHAHTAPVEEHEPTGAVSGAHLVIAYDGRPSRRRRAGRGRMVDGSL